MKELNIVVINQANQTKIIKRFSCSKAYRCCKIRRMYIVSRSRDIASFKSNVQQNLERLVVQYPSLDLTHNPSLLKMRIYNRIKRKILILKAIMDLSYSLFLLHLS